MEEPHDAAPESMREWPELLGEYDDALEAHADDPIKRSAEGIEARLMLEVAIDQRDVLRGIADSLAEIAAALHPPEQEIDEPAP